MTLPQAGFNRVDTAKSALTGQHPLAKQGEFNGPQIVAIGRRARRSHNKQRTDGAVRRRGGDSCVATDGKMWGRAFQQGVSAIDLTTKQGHTDVNKPSDTGSVVPNDATYPDDGRTEEASAAIDEALERAEAISVSYEIALALRARAEIRRRRGVPGAADDDMRADELTRELGMVRAPPS